MVDDDGCYYYSPQESDGEVTQSRQQHSQQLHSCPHPPAAKELTPEKDRGHIWPLCLAQAAVQHLPALHGNLIRRLLVGAMIHHPYVNM